MKKVYTQKTAEHRYAAAAADVYHFILGQHRTIPALRLKHRSGSCGTASALPKCSIMSGCGTRIVLRGAKAPRTLQPLPLLRFAVSATGGAHLCSIQYYLRFWLGICCTSLTVSALRIMRYCPWNPQRIPRLFALHPACVCEISVIFLFSDTP